jgi:DNA-binding CsgD family transcriptional regulator
LLAAARAASDAGSWDEAARLLADVDIAADGVEPDEHRFLGAMVAARSDPGTGAAEQLEDVARRLADRDPDRAAEALVNAALVWSTNAQRQRALAAAERAASMPFRRGGKTELAVELSLGDTAGWLGRSREAARHWQRAAQLVDDEDPEQLQMAGEALFSAGDDAAAQRLLRRAETVAREQGALDALTITLLTLGLSQTRSGDIASAHADAIDSVQLMQACGYRSDQAGAIGNVAWIEAILGREAECRAHVAESHALLAELGTSAPYGASPIGLLELSRGRPDLAIDPFEETLAVGDFRLDAEPIAPRPILPSLVEALARVGRRDDALRALGDRIEIARSTGRADAIAPLLRAQAMVEADEDLFREALVWHDRWSNRFERARTELCYGEYLRRSKRRAEARVLLRGAVDGFETVCARLWAERARAELAATGERARRRDPSTLDELTPQELTVARLVATGLTNREVAQRLFLSPKTIETHLAHVFRKTGVRTRAELAHRFRDSPDSIAVPAS